MSRIGEGTRGSREFLIWQDRKIGKSYLGRIKANDERNAISKFFERRSPFATRLSRASVFAEDIETHAAPPATRRSGDAVRDERRLYTIVYVDSHGRSIGHEELTATASMARAFLLRSLTERMKQDSLIYGGYARRESRV